MRKLTINNVGPLRTAEIDLGRINVIIGPQSSGKSCVLKIACYCTWVEKKIELAQSAEEFMKDGYFIKELTRFHKLEGYFREDSFISYESDFMRFSYEAEGKRFQFDWKDKRWEYCRPKVSYIPSERNMVAAIPNWFDVKLNNDNIQSFMADWDRARKTCTNHMEILHLGVSYRYDAQTNKDQVEVDDGITLELTNTSSGLQSLIPMYIHLNYLANLQSKPDGTQSFSNIQIGENFLRTMYDELFVKAGKTKSESHPNEISSDGKIRASTSLVLGKVGPYVMGFSNKDYLEECKSIYDRFINTDHAEIFLEEPENNLFPPTQSRLVNWLLDMTKGDHGACFFIATHSPYVMMSFLENELTDFKLFFERKEGHLSTVVTASEEDVQEIYDNGIDVFYNIESYT